MTVEPPAVPWRAPPAPEEGGERRASWLELFYDLVFVAAIAALAAQLHEDHSVQALAVFAGGFVWAQGHFLVFAGIAAAAVGIEFCVEAAAAGEALKPADRLPLGAGLAAYLVAMAMIRAATRRGDSVVAVRAGAGLVILVVALLLAEGLAPLALVAAITALFVGEAVIELRRARSA